jgi:hypothetical protein
VRSFFEATRAMYDTIAFKHEVTVESRTYLEWEGTFQGHSVAGMTVFTKDTAGLIESVRLYHRPYDMVIAAAATKAGHNVTSMDRVPSEREPNLGRPRFKALAGRPFLFTNPMEIDMPATF